MATSGFGPYQILQKVKEIKLLPTIRFECEKLLRRIDILGLDPVLVLSQAQERPSSRSLGEFLNGYVSSIQGGGNVIGYLKNKMQSINLSLITNN